MPAHHIPFLGWEKKVWGGSQAGAGQGPNRAVHTVGAPDSPSQPRERFGGPKLPQKGLLGLRLGSGVSLPASSRLGLKEGAVAAGGCGGCSLLGGLEGAVIGKSLIWGPPPIPGIRVEFRVGEGWQSCRSSSLPPAFAWPCCGQPLAQQVEGIPGNWGGVVIGGELWLLWAVPGAGVLSHQDSSRNLEVLFQKALKP